MNVQLVVISPFGAHRKGDVIADPAVVASVLAGEQALSVVRVPGPVAQPTPMQGG